MNAQLVIFFFFYFLTTDIQTGPPLFRRQRFGDFLAMTVILGDSEV